jgi:hypothetical protein
MRVSMNSSFKPKSPSCLVLKHNSWLSLDIAPNKKSRLRNGRSVSPRVSPGLSRGRKSHRSHSLGHLSRESLCSRVCKSRSNGTSSQLTASTSCVHAIPAVLNRRSWYSSQLILVISLAYYGPKHHPCLLLLLQLDNRYCRVRATIVIPEEGAFVRSHS